MKIFDKIFRKKKPALPIQPVNKDAEVMIVLFDGLMQLILELSAQGTHYELTNAVQIAQHTIKKARIAQGRDAHGA
jgi:hypothetical protein